MHLINVIFCKVNVNFQNFYNILDSILDSSRKNSDSDRLESKYQSIISWTDSTRRQKFLTHLGSTREILDSIHDYDRVSNVIYMAQGRVTAKIDICTLGYT